MRLLVMTDQHGKVIGTARMTESTDANMPFGGRPVAGDGHTIHEITLPPELHNCRSAQELHAEVSKLIRQAGPKT